MNACPACADELFTAIANEEIERLHQERAGGGRLPGLVMTALQDGAAKDAAIRRHLETRTPEVRRFISDGRVAGSCHNGSGAVDDLDDGIPF